jgi:spore coat polysaccharide biosynthesis predicted glycosyltransferase SpsG
MCRQNRKVILRADGNSEIGLGHVYRSLALAEMLNEDFETVFLIKKPLKELKRTILQTCSECIEPADGNKKQELNA